MSRLMCIKLECSLDLIKTIIYINSVKMLNCAYQDNMNHEKIGYVQGYLTNFFFRQDSKSVFRHFIVSLFCT